MITVVRGTDGPASADYPYPEPGPAGAPVGVGITTGHTVAVRLVSGDPGPLHVAVTAGQDRIRVATAPGAAPADSCQVQPGALLFLAGRAATAPGHAARVEVTQGAALAVIEPQVREEIALRMQLWTFSVSGEDPAMVDLPAAPGAYRGIDVCGAELDTGLIMDAVAASWRPAGIAVTAAAVRDGHLMVNQDQDLRTSVNAALKGHPAFQDALRHSARDQVLNIVLVSSYDRFGKAWARWGRGDTSPADAAATQQDLEGFAGPVAVIAVNGPVDQNWSWNSRSLDYRAFAPLQAPAPGAAPFHYLTCGSDVAHEIGHLLGLPHPPRTAADPASDAYLHSQLMHPDVVSPPGRWLQPGWPVTALGQMASAEVIAVLDQSAGPTRVRPAAQPATSVTIGPATSAATQNTDLLLTCRRDSQWVHLTQDIAKGQARATVSVSQFTPQRPYPLGLARLQQLRTTSVCVRGALVPAREATQAREHITSGLVYGDA